MNKSKIDFRKISLLRFWLYDSALRCSVSVFTSNSISLLRKQCKFRTEINNCSETISKVAKELIPLFKTYPFLPAQLLLFFVYVSVKIKAVNLCLRNSKIGVYSVLCYKMLKKFIFGIVLCIKFSFSNPIFIKKAEF
jgi:hypothetical protein